MSLHQAFRAGFVRRWHTNPELAHTNDRIDGHSGRVARIILMLHPSPSVELLRAALIHDDGESVVGDIPGPYKFCLKNSDCWIISNDEDRALESIWDRGADLRWIDDPSDQNWLSFADRLDAYMWAQHHAPSVLIGDGWPDARAWLEGQAIALGVSDHLHQTIGGV